MLWTLESGVGVPRIAQRCGGRYAWSCVHGWQERPHRSAAADAGNGAGSITFGPDTEPPLFPAPTTLDEIRPLTRRPILRKTREGKRWNEFIARCRYPGHKTLVGAQMSYAVHDRDGGPLAMLGFSTAAWKLAPRDRFTGWTIQLREKNLPLVADNPRFLILHWTTIPNLGSHILSLVSSRSGTDPHPFVSALATRRARRCRRRAGSRSRTREPPSGPAASGRRSPS